MANLLDTTHTKSIARHFEVWLKKMGHEANPHYATLATWLEYNYPAYESAWNASVHASADLIWDEVNK